MIIVVILVIVEIKTEIKLCCGTKEEKVLVGHYIITRDKKAGNLMTTIYEYA